jgi:hypothetical protein
LVGNDGEQNEDAHAFSVWKVVASKTKKMVSVFLRHHHLTMDAMANSATGDDQEDVAEKMKQNEEV